jgi:hypothetical protein
MCPDKAVSIIESVAKFFRFDKIRFRFALVASMRRDQQPKRSVGPVATFFRFSQILLGFAFIAFQAI